MTERQNPDHKLVLEGVGFDRENARQFCSTLGITGCWDLAFTG